MPTSDDVVGLAVVVDHDHSLHIQRRVGDLELDAAEVVERPLYHDGVVVGTMVGMGLADQLPLALRAGAGLHHLLCMRGGHQPNPCQRQGEH